MSKENKKNVAIIGAGVGGLAVAIRLAKKGYKVQVFEAHETYGGKMGEICEKGYRFDGGPSLFTQAQLVDDLTLLVEKSDSSFSYDKLDVSCKYFWEDGSVFNAYFDRDRLSKELEDCFPEDCNAVLTYLEENGRQYDSVGRIFLENSLHKIDTWLSWPVLKALTKFRFRDLLSTMHQKNRGAFKSEKLVQLFDRFATYNGSNPYQAPGMLTMIPHFEFNEGAYYPNGGMRSIPTHLYSLACALGVQFSFSEPVEEILVCKSKAYGVKTLKGEYEADYVLSNADVYPTYAKLLKNHKVPSAVLKAERSSSGIIFYWGIKKIFKELELHNIFFSNNYRSEFDCLFKQKNLFDDPTVYVNISSKMDPKDAPKGCENWFVLVNAPNNEGQDWERLINRAREGVFAKIEACLGQDIRPLIEFEEILDPVKIESRTSSYQGSLYGTSSNSPMSAFLRHKNYSSDIQGLYFCGGSVHPGGGIPLCLNSAKIVSKLISE